MHRTGRDAGSDISQDGNARPVLFCQPLSLRSCRRYLGLIPPATVIDKPAYSAFAESGLAAFLRDKSVDTLIITGSETDVCVLATVLDAVDLGFRTIVVEDALCSSFDEGHDALMTLYRNRFSEQIELMTQAQVSELWHDQ